MSETKFTPGKWVSKDGMSVIVEGSGAYVGYPPKQGAIASLFDGEYIENANRADAHLIAAAPELYEALWNMVALAEPYMRDEVQEIGLLEARAALAKARGES